MGAAAGAHVRPGESDNAHLAGEGLFAAIVQRLQLLRGGVGDDHGLVLPQIAVHRRLQPVELLLVDHGVQVDGDEVAAHVKTHIIAAPPGVGNAGDDVLPGVVLHQVKAPVPVDLPGDPAARLQRTVAGVDDVLSPGVDLEDLHAPQRPGVIGLSAPLGIERGAV